MEAQTSIMFCRVLKDSSFCLSETLAGYLEAQCYAGRFRFTAQLTAEEKLICRNIHCDSKGYHFDLSVSVCSCLSPRPDFGSKNIAEVMTLRGFRMFRFKFCRASEERLFQAARRLKRQNVPADSICFNCFSIHREAKQQSVAEQKRHTDFQGYNSRLPWSSSAGPRSLNSSKYTACTCTCAAAESHMHTVTHRRVVRDLLATEAAVHPLKGNLHSHNVRGKKKAKNWAFSENKTPPDWRTQPRMKSLANTLCCWHKSAWWTWPCLCWPCHTCSAVCSETEGA